MNRLRINTGSFSRPTTTTVILMAFLLSVEFVFVSVIDYNITLPGVYVWCCGRADVLGK